jgi:hypothetical protein
MLRNLSHRIKRHFLFLAVGFPAAPPPLFAWIRTHSSLGLGITMFGMDQTPDFARVSRLRGMAGMNMG